MKLPYVTLRIQHRMRPEIADLLRLDIYDHLDDHESVQKYETIKGVTKNVFFISHNHRESSMPGGKSKVTRYTAGMHQRIYSYQASNWVKITGSHYSESQPRLCVFRQITTKPVSFLRYASISWTKVTMRRRSRSSRLTLVGSNLIFQLLPKTTLRFGFTLWRQSFLF